MSDVQEVAEKVANLTVDDNRVVIIIWEVVPADFEENIYSPEAFQIGNINSARHQSVRGGLHVMLTSIGFQMMNSRSTYCASFPQLIEALKIQQQNPEISEAELLVYLRHEINKWILNGIYYDDTIEVTVDNARSSRWLAAISPDCDSWAVSPRPNCSPFVMFVGKRVDVFDTTIGSMFRSKLRPPL